MIQIVGITESIQDNSNHYNFGEICMVLSLIPSLLYNSIQNPEIELKI